ncbi:MAG: tape measure protein [Thiopseudomonas sp.]|nr:tape measure protein [Thiopseudomonas sp.]
MGIMQKAIAIAAGAGALGSIIKQADAYGEMASRIKMVTADTDEYYAVQRRLMEISDRTYKPLKEQQELLVRSASSMKELGYSLSDTIDFIDSTSSSLTINAASAQSGERAIAALSKSMVTGTLRGQEWNAILEVTPTAVSDIAKHLGQTETAVKQMALAGKLSMSTFVDATIAAKDANALLAENMPTTVGDALVRLGNHFSTVVGEINEAQGATSALAGLIDSFSDKISDGEFVAGAIEGFANWTTSISYISKEISSLADQVNIFTSDVTGHSFSLGAAFAEMPVNLRASIQIAVVEIANFIDGVINKAEAAAAYLRALPSGLAAASNAYDSVRASMASNDAARADSIDFILAERDAILETGRAAGDAYRTQHNANTKISTERSEAVKQLTKEQEQAAKAAAAASKKIIDAQLKALDDLIAKYNPAQKAQADYEKAIKMADAALLKNKLTTEQYQNIVQGLFKDLNKPMWDKHNKAAKEAAEAVKKIDDQLNAVRDRFDPLRAATRQLTEEKKLFKDALDDNNISLEEYQLRLAQLDHEYAQNARATSDWAKWTDSALERVDGAFADAWRNIGEGFSGFRSGLTNAFKQMLAELAHMAITRPIIMQIGAAIGIGGGAGQVAASLGGGGGIGGIANMASSAYSALTGWGKAAYTGYQGGGFSGALNGIGSYYGGMFSGGLGGFQAGVQGAYLAPGLAGPTTAGAGGLMGAGSMVGTVAAYAPWLSGLGGAFMGYQNSGLKGAAAGGLGGFAGAKAGAALGSFLPGAGTAIGAIIGGALGALGGSKLFGGKWQTKDGGYALGVSDGDFSGQQYEYQKKKGGLFRSNKKRTLYSDLDPELEASLRNAYEMTESGVTSLFESLGFGVEEGALAGLQLAKHQISTQGKTAEEISAAFGEWFGTVADAMSSELNTLLGTGLDYNFEELEAFVSNLLGVNEVLRYLNVDIYDASVAGGRLAESLTAAAGGFDVLAANTATYYDQFFTETEKAEDVIDAVTRAFADAGVELTSSRESYRAMVEDIDLTTEAGQKMFATMMSLAGAASQYFSIVEQQAAQAIAAANQQAAQATSTAMTAAGAAYNTLQRSVQAERNRLTQEFQKSAQQEQARASQIASQQSASAAAYASQLQSLAGASQALVTALAGINNAMSSALDRLRDTSSNVVAFRRDQSVDLLRSALVQAQAGASLSTIDGIEAALDTASMLDSDTYRSMEDFKREQGRTSNLISELQTLNGKQLTIEEQLLEQLKLRAESAKSSASQISAGVSGVSYQLQAKYDADMAALDEELAAAALQMDAMNGIDNTILTVGMAIDQMSAAVVAAINAQQREISIVTGSPQPAPEASSPAATIDRLYKSIVGYGADAQGIKFWSEQLASGGTYADLISALGSAAKGAAVPAFAAGGSHSGGLRLVGENGPELEVTGPSRIHSASQTAALLGGGGDTAAAVHELRQSVESQADALRSIAKHTQQTAKRVEFIERWDYDGMPKERSAT